MIPQQQSHWFVAVVTPNTEKSCQKQLDALIEVLKKDRNDQMDDEDKEANTIISYVPVQRELHEWPSTGKRVWVDKVICPCYLFIRCTDKERYNIACQAKFILHFMMDRARKNANGRNDFARIPADQMKDFMLMVGDGERMVSIEPANLRVGDRVRIKSGRLAGLEGHVFKAPDAKTTKLAFRIDFLGYATMECPIELMEVVKDKY